MAIITIISTSTSVPSYSFDAGDISNEDAARAAAKLARQCARQINGAVVETVSSYNAEMDDYDYAYAIRERDWGFVTIRTIETVRISVSR